MDQRSVRDILAGKTYFIRTFGCQMNQHDSERVSGLLDSYGCLMALDPAHADIVVFMTCCVREAADTRLYGQCNSCKSLAVFAFGQARGCRWWLHRAARWRGPAHQRR